MADVESWLQDHTLHDKVVGSQLASPAEASVSGECIPGVPEDVILEILSKAPRGSAFSFRHVSKAWRRAAASDVIRQNKAANGSLEQWLFVLPEFPKGGPFRAFDPTQNTWHVVPPIPLHAAARAISAASSAESNSLSSRSSSFSADSSPELSPACSPPHFGDAGSSLEGFACAAAGGKLLVFGGSQQTTDLEGTTHKSVTSSVWEFDPAAWCWAHAPPLRTGRGWAAASTLHDRFVVVSGGQSDRGFLKSVEVYDALERRWSKAGSMTSARCSHRSVVANGKVFVIAGEVERHDAAHLQPQVAEQAPLGARGGAVGNAFMSLSARLRPGNFLRPARGAEDRAGERRASVNASMEVFDLESDSWTFLPNAWLNGAKVPCPVAVVNDHLYAVHNSSVHVFDEGTATWQLVGDTPGRDGQGRPLQVSGLGAAEVDGKLVLFGGSRDVWSGRNRVTQQNLGNVHTWQPPEMPCGSGTAGAGAGQASNGVNPIFRMTPPRHSIMMWKELPAIKGAGGHILSSAVLTF